MQPLCVCSRGGVLKLVLLVWCWRTGLRSVCTLVLPMLRVPELVGGVFGDPGLDARQYWW